MLIFDRPDDKVAAFIRKINHMLRTNSDGGEFTVFIILFCLSEDFADLFNGFFFIMLIKKTHLEFHYTVHIINVSFFV